MVNTPPRLTPLRYLPRDVLNQMVSISNRYTCHRLVLILLIIGMISLPNLFQQTLYNRNNTHKIRKFKYKNHVNILTKTGDTYKEVCIAQCKFPCALVIVGTQPNSLSQETQVCIYMLQVEYIYISLINLNN